MIKKKSHIKELKGFFYPLNTKYATDSYFVYVLKMEYVPKMNTFGLTMMVLSMEEF